MDSVFGLGSETPKCTAASAGLLRVGMSRSGTPRTETDSREHSLGTSIATARVRETSQTRWLREPDCRDVAARLYVAIQETRRFHGCDGFVVRDCWVHRIGMAPRKCAGAVCECNAGARQQ